MTQVLAQRAHRECQRGLQRAGHRPLRPPKQHPHRRQHDAQQDRYILRRRPLLAPHRRRRTHTWIRNRRRRRSMRRLRLHVPRLAVHAPHPRPRKRSHPCLADHLPDRVQAPATHRSYQSNARSQVGRRPLPAYALGPSRRRIRPVPSRVHGSDRPVSFPRSGNPPPLSRKQHAHVAAEFRDAARTRAMVPSHNASQVAPTRRIGGPGDEPTRDSSHPG